MKRLLLVVLGYGCLGFAAWGQTEAPVPHSSRLPPTRRYAPFHALSIPYLDFDDVMGPPGQTVQAQKRVHKTYDMEKVYDGRGNLVLFTLRDPEDTRMELKAKFTYRGDTLIMANVAHKEPAVEADRYLMFRVRNYADSTLILPTIFRGSTFRQVVIRYYKDGTMRSMEVEVDEGTARLDFKYLIRDPQYTEVNVTPLIREGQGPFATVKPRNPVLREVLRYNQSYTMRTRLMQQ